MLFIKKNGPSQPFDFEILLGFWEQKYWNSTSVFGEMSDCMSGWILYKYKSGTRVLGYF